MQFSFRDVLEQQFGAEGADSVFRQAGYLAGRAFYDNNLVGSKDFNEFIFRMQSSLKDWGIGILRMEKVDLPNYSFVLTISEDADCSGLPDINAVVCVYDEGFLAALLESFFERRFRVREIDCWCTGDRTCRFEAELVQ